MKFFYKVLQIIAFILLIYNLFLFMIYSIYPYLFKSIFAAMFIIITYTFDQIIKSRILFTIFLVFCIFHFILGEIFDFYIIVDWWDSFLHTSSGFVIGILAYSLVKNTNEYKIEIIFIFSIALATLIGVVWELFEFGMDYLFKTNMQRYINDQTSLPFIGQDALKDTMKDLFLDIIGSLIASIIGLLIYKNKK